MKKFIGILLLLILLFSISAQFVVFKAAQYAIKKEIKQKIKNQIPKTELIAITFSSAELKDIKWEEKGKEFWLNGNIYDVVNTSENVDFTTFFCINDKQEKTLFANLDELINRQMNSETNTNALKKLPTDYFFAKIELPVASSTSKCTFHDKKQNLLQGHFSTNILPPEQA